METAKHEDLKDLQTKAIKALDECDHLFLPKEEVLLFTKPFGFEGTTYTAKANPSEFKGLSLWDKDGNPVDSMEGQDATVIAEEIALKLNLGYSPMEGRGSRLHERCRKILEYLEK
jgi:hypothetical protein